MKEPIRAEATLSLFELDAAYGNLLEYKLERLLADLRYAARLAGDKLPGSRQVFVTVTVTCVGESE